MEKQFFHHASAIIDEGATIGAGTKIWHFSHIMANAKIGRNCILGQNVFVDNNVVIGNGVKIQNNVSVYNGVVIEDDVFLGPSMVFTNVLNPRSFIERKDEFRSTIVRKGATIGANVTVVCGTETGQYAMVGAGSVVTKNVLPFS
ncbi:MAG TPA: DapH/DapD/GlmU-related protein, partial [Flavisolibacter sp.]|nr:DapH/DapD/GlmU-related protein [Flavisolibacter sp.]